MNRSNRKCHAGAAVVEFAIILPLLLLMLYGITEIGRAIYQQNILYKGLMAGSRYLARANGVIVLDTDDNSCSKGPNFSTMETNTKNLIAATVVDFPGFNTADITINVPAQAVFGDGDVIGCKIRITADAQFNALFVPLDSEGFGSFNIHAETEERYIGL